jgi:hypothetical protein
MSTTATLVAEHGGYAIVRLNGGKFQGGPLDGEVLVEHFGFGWQNVDFENDAFRCRVPNASCRTASGDVGSPSDVDAVRELMQGYGLVVDAVRVSGNYALAYHDLTGGQVLFHKMANRWRKRSSSGCGMIGASDLVAEGVPAHDAQTLVHY